MMNVEGYHEYMIRTHITECTEHTLYWVQLICGCRVFNNYKNSNHKKLRRNRQKFEIFFGNFFFSQKIINIHLYIPYKAFIRSIV